MERHLFTNMYNKVRGMGVFAGSGHCFTRGHVADLFIAHGQWSFSCDQDQTFYTGTRMLDQYYTDMKR